jgi:hypothetical protein
MSLLLTRTAEEPVWLFPFEGMGIGDSFFVPTLKPSHLIYCVDTRAKAAKIKVKAYAVCEEQTLGVRVWRTG